MKKISCWHHCLSPPWGGPPPEFWGERLALTKLEIEGQSKMSCFSSQNNEVSCQSGPPNSTLVCGLPCVQKRSKYSGVTRSPSVLSVPNPASHMPVAKETAPCSALPQIITVTQQICTCHKPWIGKLVIQWTHCLKCRECLSQVSVVLKSTQDSVLMRALHPYPCPPGSASQGLI